MDNPNKKVENSIHLGLLFTTIQNPSLPVCYIGDVEFWYDSATERCYITRNIT